jgi:hypothetical protein
MKTTKRIALLLLVIAAGVFMDACRKDKPVPPANGRGTYRLQFSSNVNGSAFHTDSTYMAANGRIQLSMLTFYIGYPRLVKTDGTEVPLADVLMVDFTPGDLSNPSRDKLTVDTAFSYTIPAGSYKAIKFGLGVPPQFNAGSNFNPYKWPTYNALGAGFGQFWDMNPSAYRFIAMNGNIDTARTGKFVFRKTLEYHILGVDSSDYRPIEIATSFTVDDAGTQVNTIAVDIARILANGSSALDLRTQNSTMNATAQERPAATIILNNMQSVLQEK